MATNSLSSRSVQLRDVVKGSDQPGKKIIAAAVAGVIFAAPVGAAQLEEIVVTATRRDQSIQDIPYNISALSGSDLRKSGVTDLAGLARQIPGFTYIDLGARANGLTSGIVLRGLNASAAGANNFAPPPGNPTVTTYLNETPLFTNLKIADVERVEVLRGPQGTLYGAGAVGGTVRFVYNKPDTQEFSADLQGKVGQTEDSGDLNHGADGVLNIPLHDTLALRIAAGYEESAGVIDATNLIVLDNQGLPQLADPSDPYGSDAVNTSKDDVDESTVSYVRASVLWNISEDFEALLSYHLQKDEVEDYTGQNPVSGNREHRFLNTSPWDKDSELLSLELNANLGFATVTLAGSYTKVDQVGVSDATGYIQSTVDSFYLGYPRPSYLNGSEVNNEQYIYELRIVSETGKKFDWVAGLYYSDYEHLNDVGSYPPGWSEWMNTPAPAGVGPSTFLGAGATWAQVYRDVFGFPDADFSSPLVFTLDQKTTTKEKAVFGELTYHISDAWQVTGGFRYFDLDDKRVSDVGVPYIQLSNTGISEASDTGSLLKVNTSYEFGDDLMVYFTRSEGYRQGGANPVPTIGPFAIPDPALIPYEPDTAINWEVGIKGQFSDWLRYSASLYLIEWEDVQIQLPAPGSGIAILVNGGDATSKGVELEFAADLTERMTVRGGYSYIEPQLDTDFFITSGVLGFKGDNLPGVPENQLSLAMDYVMPIADSGAELQFHLDGSYRSGVETALNPQVGNYAELDGFTLWNAAVNLNSGNWRGGLYVNNLFDEDAITAVNYPFSPFTDGDIQFIGRPRTVGLMVGYSF